LGDVDWEIDTMEYTLIQKNTLQLPYLGPLDYAPLYLNVCGRGYVEPDGAVLSLSLADTQLSGKAYRTTLELENDTRKPFASSMIEVAPETTDETHAAYDKPGHLYGGYELKAKVSDGTGYIDQGTCVQVWSE
jgi:hypothetical protein